MSTVYQTNPKTGVMYAYSTESYWDKDAKRPRNKREYLGRVDPVTKEIIPKKSGTRKNTGTKKAASGDVDELYALLEKKDRELKQKDQQITKLQDDLTVLQKKHRTAVEMLHGIAKTISSSDL